VIDSETGTVRTTASFDREIKNEYYITVVAEDGAPSNRSNHYPAGTPNRGIRQLFLNMQCQVITTVKVTSQRQQHGSVHKIKNNVYKITSFNLVIGWINYEGTTWFLPSNSNFWSDLIREKATEFGQSLERDLKKHSIKVLSKLA